MDCLTAHLLACELDERWRGKRLAGVDVDGDARAIHVAVEGNRGATFDLSAPDVEVREGAALSAGPLLSGWRIAGVRAPIDERLISIECEKVGKFRGSPLRRAHLVVSVVPAARGALLEDASGHRLASLGSRLPSPAEPRPQPSPTEVDRAARAGDAESLARARWMSPALAEWLMSEPGLAAVRYAAICAMERPSTELCERGLLPPWLCGGASLLRPAAEAPEETTAVGDDWRDRALQRMREQLHRAADAPRLRSIADALSAFGDAEPPATLTLASGERATVDARPGESAIAAAERLYREVRSMERALKSLPRRIAELEAKPSAERPARRGTTTRERDPVRPARPFRLYRSSGGLEIWVGRGAASNDAITFRESSPSDVWMHARAAAGAHVILRWSGNDSPPARDLEEAAMLAAWHSKARGSTVVPVDWTRRRYVRKPRGAGPGKVVITHAQTLFVRPTQEVERRLRDTG